MQGQKLPPYEGADGILYFNFGIGLKVECRETTPDRGTEQYTLEIVDCRLIRNTEYYDVLRDGVLLPQPITANRVKYILTWYGIKTLSSGVRKEMPLLIEEISQYYEYCESFKREKEQRLANIPEYQANDSELRKIAMQLGFASAFGKTDEEKRLMSEQERLSDNKKTLLKKYLGISEKELEGSPFCEKCNRKGFFGYDICQCAIKHTAQIKQYCAKERQRFKGLLNT